MSKRGIALTLICSVALLAGCADQPTSVEQVQTPTLNSVPADLVEPPWAKNWDRLLGPEALPPEPFNLDLPCISSPNTWHAWWSVYWKETVTGSGNVNTNTKVWWYPGVTKLVGDAGEEFLLTHMTQSWNWHEKDGIRVDHAAISEHYENPVTGERIKGTEVVTLTWSPDPNEPPAVEFKRFDFKCIGKK